jgi:hypothetical protein
MSDFQILLLAVLEKKPLAEGQESLAQTLSTSRNPFERLVGTLAINITKKALKLEFIHDQLMQYAQEVLFRLFNVRSSPAVHSPKVKKFVFRAARSENDSDRLNATQILVEMAKKERSAYAILKKLKSDPAADVRNNAEILLRELSLGKNFL